MNTSTPSALGPDWALMIEQLVGAGLGFATIAKATRSELTERMVKHYAGGVQPLHWRGELLISLWCETFDADRTALPRCEIVRGHRVEPRGHQGPRAQNLPQWPRVGSVAP